MPTKEYTAIAVNSENAASGSIVFDKEETTFISNIPFQKAVSIEMAIKYGLPVDSFNALREELFDVFRVVLFTHGHSPIEVSNIINEVKVSMRRNQ